jgi:transcription initiation factor IIF auxiliary subunit
MAYKLAQDFEYKGKDWWEWWVWVEASDDELDKIKFVEYTLHPTFAKPVREISDRATKFLLKTAGWGIFTIYAKLAFKDGKTKSLEHDLILRYDDGTRTFA